MDPSADDIQDENDAVSLESLNNEIREEPIDEQAAGGFAASRHTGAAAGGGNPTTSLNRDVNLGRHESTTQLRNRAVT